MTDRYPPPAKYERYWMTCKHCGVVKGKHYFEEYDCKENKNYLKGLSKKSCKNFEEDLDNTKRVCENWQ